MRYLVAKGGIKVWHLLVNGVMYVSYLVLVLS
jgi:cation:H+ antiporter